MIFEGIRSLLASGPVQAWRRVAYQNGEYLVAVRGYGEWHNIKEFVQPDDPQVKRLYQEIGPDPWECYRYVCEKISYDRERREFWRWPAETLAGRGDCEDTSILLASLLRNFTDDACVVVGKYRGYGHAWVQAGSLMMETTLSEPIVVDDPENYVPMFVFNDLMAEELWPGSLEQVLSARRNDYSKMRLLGHLTNI